ncbi:probable E3 ubiquitin-protein ligase HIP1 [Manihot esculenta]|uniref:RING-type E3 ubiquitin transferase n=1 Tax=Manihot esculenta TaxID=3983 RepID=A0A2C9WN87_MANES|nr:probable E3 ubiquitin-protein ligase HIP1 [Manihot esculenta]OAY61318.1 hypothetical protein MANES_01G180000v8 [Manihot esculenta]
MDELQIATEEAEVLHRMSNWGVYSTFDGSYDPRTIGGKLDPDELRLAKLEGMKRELARLRARDGNREFDVVLREVEFEVMIQLGMILAKSIDPVLKGLKKVKIEEGEVCGVCQEEMEMGDEGRAMECMHKFHGFCIVQWLKMKKTCPLCRYEMHIHQDTSF